MTRADTRTVDLEGPSVYQGGPKFEIKHKSHYFQKSKPIDWGGGGGGRSRQAYRGSERPSICSNVISAIFFYF